MISATATWAVMDKRTFNTPNLDRLAAEGMRFTQAYAGSTVCAPSRCALMTGLHTGHARIRGNAQGNLRDEDVTIAEVLKPAGYQTAHIGKWGCGMPGSTGEPHKQGFDHWFGYVTNGEAHNYYPALLWKNGERFDAGQRGRQGRFDQQGDVFARSVHGRALRFIEENKERPFFLYLAIRSRTPTTRPATKAWRCPTTASMPTRTGPSRKKAARR